MFSAAINTPQDVCVPQLLTKQAKMTPGAIALVAGEQSLTYEVLNQRSNQFARYLRTLGVGPDVLVGCCIERSLDLVVALLGILKAGGAYVPMDPTYPAERLCFMLRDSDAPVLVTQQKLLERLPSLETQVVCLDRDAMTWMQQDAGDVAAFATASNLAYVIYTSGSTGQPKGVEIMHTSLLNLICWHQDVFTTTASDRATHVCSPAFDASGWELWPYLTSGASVYLPDEETRNAPLLLRDWLINNEITITFLPTVLAESLMSVAWPLTASLRFLLVGGEALHRYPSPSLPFAVVNNYGPTEATVVTTYAHVDAATHSAKAPAIGCPIANTQVYILDEYLQQVPIGIAGELHIGGVGLARGYHNRPELTAAKFIRHPFHNEPGARLYKTGDVGRYLPNGQVEFLGRIDHQVKIRGFRIELGEIEVLLNQHAAVQQAVVNVCEDMSGEKRLVGYIVARRGSDGITGDILSSTQHADSMLVGQVRQSLSECLPDYMLPTAFVLLNALPLTPNGKVDRAALPAADATNSVQEGASVEGPATPTEERLATIVATLLKLARVGRDDNFFLLGGHSLLGTQVIMRTAETFGVRLTLRSLFDAPTVRQLALEIERLLVAKLQAMSEDEVEQLLEKTA